MLVNHMFVYKTNIRVLWHIFMIFISKTIYLKLINFNKIDKVTCRSKMKTYKLYGHNLFNLNEKYPQLLKEKSNGDAQFLFCQT